MDKSTQRKAVENYALMLAGFETRAFAGERPPADGSEASYRAGVHSRPSPPGLSSEEFAWMAEADFRSAKIFICQAERGEQLIKQARSAGASTSDEDFESRARQLLSGSPLPFDSCFVSFGGGVDVIGDVGDIGPVTRPRRAASERYVLGLMICSGAQHHLQVPYALYQIQEYHWTQGGLERHTYLTTGPAPELRTNSLSSSFALEVVRDIVEGPGLVPLGTPSRSEFRKEAARAGVVDIVPRPFYSISPRTAKPKSSSIGPVTRPRSWRHDVTGHWRMRVKRWSAEKHSDALVRAYRRRQYVVLCPHEELSEEAGKHLRERGIEPKKAGEYLAYRLTWIEPHVSPKNPELPYVPALRST